MQRHNKIIVLNCDGASKGNPGRAGIGGIARDESGKILFEFSECIGVATNNVAEYKALIRGLRKISGIPGKKHVRVYTDSELMARQINGLYRVKEPSLQILIQEVFRLKNGFSGFEIKHVPREQNKEADFLANKEIGKKKDEFLVLKLK